MIFKNYFCNKVYNNRQEQHGREAGRTHCFGCQRFLHPQILCSQTDAGDHIQQMSFFKKEEKKVMVKRRDVNKKYMRVKISLLRFGFWQHERRSSRDVGRIGNAQPHVELVCHSVNEERVDASELPKKNMRGLEGGDALCGDRQLLCVVRLEALDVLDTAGGL